MRWTDFILALQPAVSRIWGAFWESFSQRGDKLSILAHPPWLALLQTPANLGSGAALPDSLYLVEEAESSAQSSSCLTSSNPSKTESEGPEHPTFVQVRTFPVRQPMPQELFERVQAQNACLLWPSAAQPLRSKGARNTSEAFGCYWARFLR